MQAKKYNFFTNNILNSNVWALSKDDDDSYATETRRDSIKTKNKNRKPTTEDGRRPMVFDQVESNVIAKELGHQKQFIKNQMLIIEQEYEHDWKQLKNNIKSCNIGVDNSISQNHLIIAETTENEIKENLMEMGVQSDYNLGDMPFDNANKFKGNEEYDFMGYLTKILMVIYILLLFEYSLIFVFVCLYQSHDCVSFTITLTLG